MYEELFQSSKKKFAKEFPPIDFQGDTLYFKREYKDPFITMYFLSGDSYDLTAEEVERYLKIINVVDPATFIDYVWNFYSAKLNIVTTEFEWVPKDDLLIAVNRGEEVLNNSL